MKRIACVLAVLLCAASFAAAEGLSANLAETTREALLSSVTEGTDAWDKYLLGQSVSVDSVSDAVATVSVPSWEPNQSGIENASLDDVAQSVKQATVTGEIRFGRDETGKLSIFGADTFRKKVVSAAAEAKRSFNSPWLRQALSRELFPAVYSDQGGYTQSFAGLAAQYGSSVTPYYLEAALTMQKAGLLNVEEGPTRLKISLSRANTATVARSAYLAAYEVLKNTDKSNAYSREQIDEILSDRFIQSAASLSDADFTVEGEAQVDMERVLSGDYTVQAVADYAGEIEAALSEKLDTLQIAVSYLPDYPSRNQPDSGVIKGPVSGTHVAFISPDDGFGRVVSLLDPETGRAALTLFIRSGESVDAYVPSGKYLLVYGKGTEWYGMVKRFGSDAAYAESIVSIGISQSDGYHEIRFIGDGASDVSGVKVPMRLSEYVEPD